jgi:hypothetical protein
MNFYFGVDHPLNERRDGLLLSVDLHGNTLQANREEPRSPDLLILSL